MEEYDENIRYFGPQDSILCSIIPPFPPGVPQLKEVFNKAGFTHDVGYTGKRRTGFFGKLRDAWERWRIDDKFHANMYRGIDDYARKELITQEQADIAYLYADTAYKAVRLGGWTFFRKGGSNV